MTDKWDEQIERDIKAGILDGLANQAIANYKSGKSSVLNPSTDLGRFVELYKSFGIEVNVNTDTFKAMYIVGLFPLGNRSIFDYSRSMLDMKVSRSSKVMGGSLFFEFTLQGDFVGMSGSEYE